jgi:dihydrofolate reductase
MAEQSGKGEHKLRESFSQRQLAFSICRQGAGPVGPLSLAPGPGTVLGETQMSNYVYIAASLDGFIATEDGGVEWLHDLPNPDQSDFGYSDFISSIDAIVMGRKTFEKVLSFGVWPYERPVFVLSYTLESVPSRISDKAEIMSGDVPSVVDRLKARGYVNLYIDGGVTLQSFLQLDLIDELIVTRFPILLGSGVPLFGKLPAAMKFSLQGTEVLNGSLVKCHYRRCRA